MYLAHICPQLWSWLSTACLTVGIVLLTPNPGLTIPVQDVPNPKKTYNTWIVDTANVLSADTEVMLNQKISELKTTKRSEIIIVTVNDTKPSPSPEDFARELFDDWDTVFPHMKNSVLLVVSKYENHAAIEVGDRLRSRVHPVEIKKILVNHIYLSLENDSLEKGIIYGVEDLLAMLKPPSSQWSIFKDLLVILLSGGLALFVTVPFVKYFRH